MPKNKFEDIQLNTKNNPFDAEASRRGGLFTRKSIGKCYAYVPPGAILIMENRFDGTIEWRKNSGLNFMTPFMYKSYLIWGSQVNVDYEKIQYQTQDGIDVSVDLALFIRIVDPAKYKIASARPMEDLKLTISELIKNYVRANTYDYLSKDTFDLGKIDPYGKLKEFCDINGIEVTGGKFKQIDLPERLKKVFDDKAEALRRREVVDVEQDTKMKEKEKEMDRLELEIDRSIKMFKNKFPNIDDKELMGMIKSQIFKNSFYVDGNDGAAKSSAVNGAIYGQSAADTMNTSKNKTLDGTYSYKGGDLQDNVYHVDDNNEDVDLHKFKGRR